MLDKCKSNESCGEGYCCAFNFQHNFGYCMPNRGLGEKCSVTYMVRYTFSIYIAWSSLVLFKQKAALHRIPKREFSLREKCPNTELFLVRIFLYSD